MTFDEAKTLAHGQVIHHLHLKNADGTPQRFRVNGKVRTWKRDPMRIEIPVKRGMYEFGTIVGPTLAFFVRA